MANSYTRMVLVRPDLMEKTSNPTTEIATLPPRSSDAQTAYYDKQLIRERLSPDNGLIQVLTHLQKEADRVLHDSNLPSSSKIHQYNQLMVKSAILMRKAKTVGRAAPRRRPVIEEEADSVSYPNLPLLSTDDEDTDSEEDEEDRTRWVDAASHVGEDGDLQSRPPSRDSYSADGAYDIPPQSHRSPVKSMDRLISQQVPATYRARVRSLYKLLEERAAHHDVNWTRTGELIVGHKRVPGTNLLELLTDAARERSNIKPPVGRDVFISVVKRLNPTLKHVKNKAAFRQTSTISAPSLSGIVQRRKSLTTKPYKKKKTHSEQEGRGRKLKHIIWRTKL